MPKLTRLTSQYVRRELQRVFRDNYLPLVARHIVAQRDDGGGATGRWQSFRINFDVESMRATIEMMEALPRSRIERGPANLLREYRKELMIWRRKRTTARARVAKYTRLVRYHSKPGKRRGGGGVTQRALIGGVPGGMSCWGSVRTSRSDGSTYS